MKEIRLCSHCGSYELVSFDYDPDRGGVPRLFGYVNDNVIDMDYDEEEERFGFWLDGVYCRKCNTLDDTYYWKVPDNFTGTETGHILSERDSKLVMINKYMVRVLSGLNDKEKLELIKEIKESIYDIIKKYNVEDIFDDLIKIINEITICYHTAEGIDEETMDEFFKWLKPHIEDIVIDRDVPEERR